MVSALNIISQADLKNDYYKTHIVDNLEKLAIKLANLSSITSSEKFTFSDSIENGEAKIIQKLNCSKVSILNSSFVFNLNFAKLWILMNFVHSIKQFDEYRTLREGFYSLKQYYRHQMYFTKHLNFLTSLMVCPRISLGLIASSSGLIAGLVLWKERGLANIDLSKYSRGGKHIPGNVSSVSFETLGCKYIIVIEKDAIFNILCEEKFWNKFPCVILTGCGYPSLSVIDILHKLSLDLKCVIFGLFDYNPHGFRIFLNYKYRSINLQLISNLNMHWLGLHFLDLFLENGIKLCSNSYLLQWNFNDFITYKSIKRNYQLQLSYCLELEKMHDIELKAEIEAIQSTSEYISISDFIAKKIINVLYI